MELDSKLKSFGWFVIDKLSLSLYAVVANTRYLCNTMGVRPIALPVFTVLIIILYECFPYNDVDLES